jgi:hypothetical protein
MLRVLEAPRQLTKQGVQLFEPSELQPQERAAEAVGRSILTPALPKVSNSLRFSGEIMSSSLTTGP